MSLLIDTTGLLHSVWPFCGSSVGFKGTLWSLKHCQCLFQRSVNTVFIMLLLCPKATYHFLLYSILFHLFCHPEFYIVCVCIYIYVNSWNCAIRSVGTGRIFIRLIPDLSDRLVPDSPGVAMSHGAFLEAQSRAHSDPWVRSWEILRWPTCALQWRCPAQGHPPTSLWRKLTQLLISVVPIPGYILGSLGNL